MLSTAAPSLRRPAGEAGDFRRVPISAAAFRMVVMALPFSHVPGGLS